MFREAKVGDRVWDMRLGWGVITCKMYDETALKVDFDCGGGCYYYTDGKTNSLDKNPTLFWDEVKFEIPKKPFDLEEEYRKLERKKFKVREENWFLSFDYCDMLWESCYTDREIELGRIHFKHDLKKFADLLNEHIVMPQRLNEVIKKVEREEENVQDRGKSDS